MPSPVPPPDAPLSRRAFFGLSTHEFDELTRAWGWPRFRADQVRDWAYRKLVTDPAAMTNLSKLDRARLAAELAFLSGEISRRQDSTDGTIKLLLTWPGAPGSNAPGSNAPGSNAPGSNAPGSNANAETVMIPDGQRLTACVSSQVGCPVGCTFCASGLNGVKGNLSAGQIVEQVVALNGVLGLGEAERRRGEETKRRRDRETNRRSVGQPRTSSLRLSVSPSPERISNIVFMGMGEPLANYRNVMQAVRILHDPRCLNIGARKITISTVGVPTRMRELAHEDLPLNLAISLHAPNESLRRQLIPWAEHFALDDILAAARYYFDKTGREVTLEYILLSGVNDRPEHARELAKLCRTLRANVNLIRYNEVPGLPYKRPVSQDVMNFQAILRNNGVNAHVRKSRGRDIDAACGQLRRSEQQRAQSSPQLVQLGPGAPRRGNLQESVPETGQEH